MCSVEYMLCGMCVLCRGDRGDRTDVGEWAGESEGGED